MEWASPVFRFATDAMPCVLVVAHTEQVMTHGLHREVGRVHRGIAKPLISYQKWKDLETTLLPETVTRRSPPAGHRPTRPSRRFRPTPQVYMFRHNPIRSMRREAARRSGTIHDPETAVNASACGVPRRSS